jgi:hypothetical protein
MTSDIRKLATLVKTVFGGDKGKELLDMWKATDRPVFLSDSRSQDVLLGKQLRTEEIEYFLNATAADIKKMEEAESYDIDSNDF